MGDKSDAQIVAVIGGGTMGRGIAYCAMAAGLNVRIGDADPDVAESAVAWAGERAAREGVEGMCEALADLSRTACDAHFVIEAVAEDCGVKAAVLRQAGNEARSDAILTSNTSGLSIDAIGTGSGFAERVVGMHFFNPVHRMRLCEIVVGRQTSVATVAAAMHLAERLGKTPVKVTDTPGFLASRLNCAVGNEALRMLEQGVATPDAIDAAARLGLSYPMGPLELLDIVGLDVRLAALRTLQDAFGEHFRPTQLHERLVAEGRLGVKSGAGIYDYDFGKRVHDAERGENRGS